jgi:threonine synthase
MEHLQEKQYTVLSHYIFLSFTIDTLEVERRKLSRTSDIKLSETFIMLIDAMLACAKKQRRSLKETMHKEQLFIQPLGSNDVFTSFLFILDKKEERRDFFNPAIRKKVEAILIELKREAQTNYHHLYQKPTLSFKQMFFSHIS